MGRDQRRDETQKGMQSEVQDKVDERNKRKEALDDADKALEEAKQEGDADRIKELQENKEFAEKNFFFSCNSLIRSASPSCFASSSALSASSNAFFLLLRSSTLSCTSLCIPFCVSSRL